MHEFHNVGRTDAAIRLLAAMGVIALVRLTILSSAQRILMAMLVVMPLFVYLFITALIRDDVLYVLWDIDTTRPRGQKWGGHHGDHDMRFE